MRLSFIIALLVSWISVCGCARWETPEKQSRMIFPKSRIALDAVGLELGIAQLDSGQADAFEEFWSSLDQLAIPLELRKRLDQNGIRTAIMLSHAPAILHEHGPDYFEDYQDSPYMERTLRFTENGAAKVPGVVHVDRSGRLQSLTRERNPKFHALIEAFHGLTGVPLVLNTSFNIMGKPIIHSAEDAVTMLHTTGLDAVVVEDYLLEP